MTTTTVDRRIKDRYEAQCLRVRLREQGFLGREVARTAATCLDMNRYGMALLCPRPIEAGTRVMLDFAGKYINESRVSARIIDAQPFQTGYRLSVQFSYLHEKRGYSRAIDNALSRIEGFYNRVRNF